MSREMVRMLDGTMLVLGYDRPFNTWYAMHHDDQDENSSPRVVIGYHLDEQQLLLEERPDAIVGPYPVETAKELLTELIPNLMGIHGTDEQPMCRSCGREPWERNDDCSQHPEGRLRNG